MKTESQKGWMLGVVAAVGASLCCITPVFAFLGGISGMAATFSWLEPFRPFLIGITVLVLGFAWYQQLKPGKQQVECDCEDETRKTRFLHSKKFLVIVTIVVVAMSAFPNYSHIFYPNIHIQRTDTAISDNVRLVEFEIEGMTCKGCEQHVNYEVNQLPGILETHVSYKDAVALVKFDTSMLSEDKITQAVNSTGYKVVGIHEKKLYEVISDPDISQ